MRCLALYLLFAIPLLVVRELCAAEPMLEAKDAVSSITVSVQKDLRMLYARNKGGKTIWQLDLIKAAGVPLIGKPEVRHLTLKGGKLIAVFGKHSHAEVDLQTGKLLSIASD